MQVLLFERATFLVVSHCQQRPHRDAHRFEKVSNIVKQFKLSCSKLAAQFQSMEVSVSLGTQLYIYYYMVFFLTRLKRAVPTLHVINPFTIRLYRVKIRSSIAYPNSSVRFRYVIEIGTQLGQIRLMRSIRFLSSI